MKFRCVSPGLPPFAYCHIHVSGVYGKSASEGVSFESGKSGGTGMKQLWCPWRIQYILEPKADACVFCLPECGNEDGERLILHRGTRTFVVMNKYPYNNGHLLIAPYRHVMRLRDLDTEESAEVMALLQRCTGILDEHFSPHGINIGLNLGEAAGAGIREHLHFHLVPRWNGDSSFMAVMDEVRVMPEHLHSTYSALKKYFD